MLKDRTISQSHINALVFIFQFQGISGIISNTDLPFDRNNSNNDWIILKLDAPLTMGSDVQAACLPSPSYMPDNITETRCFTSGWGQLSNGMQSI